MKKFWILIISLALFATMAACGAEPDAPVTADPTETATVPTTEETQPTETEEILDNTAYLNVSLTCDPNDLADDVCSLALSPDLTFRMTVNLLEGYGSFSGTYVLTKDGIVECTVTFKDFSGFTGEELASFSLLPEDGDCYTIRLDGIDQVGALTTNSILRAN